MGRKEVLQDTELIIINFNNTSPYQITLTSKSQNDINITFQLSAAFFIGHDVISWISRYIDDHEGVFGDLSSCFLYHAALAMPKPLVYAAEIICFLMGAKPVVMIQYTSVKDHQTKFPYVRELSNTIIAAVEANSSNEIDYRIHSYYEDDTLILFRKNKEYLVDSLLPHKQAQALHIAPYPDRDNPSLHHQQYKDQIFNSWWNGYILGYPEYFIDIYCKEFDNSLSLEEKEKEISRAKFIIRKYLIDNNLQAPRIKLGLDRNILQEIRQLDLI
jgi:hypothetical protein